MPTHQLRKQPEYYPNLAAKVLRSDGVSEPAIITRLWYDGCELSSDEEFADGENVQVFITGMGNIRASVVRANEATISLRFREDCSY